MKKMKRAPPVDAKTETCRCCNGSKVMPEYVRKNFAARGMIGIEECIFCREGHSHNASDPSKDPFTPERIDGFLDFMCRKFIEETRPPSLRARMYELAGCTGDLEEFFEHIKTSGRESFLRNGGVPSTLFLLARDDNGEYRVIQIPCPWEDQDETESMVAWVRAAISSNNHGTVLSYCFVGEAWASISGSTPPSEALDRTELLHVFAEQRGKPETLYTSADIKRHALSPKPSLGEWIGLPEHGSVTHYLFDDMFSEKSDDGLGVFFDFEQRSLN